MAAPTDKLSTIISSKALYDGSLRDQIAQANGRLFQFANSAQFSLNRVGAELQKNTSLIQKIAPTINALAPLFDKINQFIELDQKIQQAEAKGLNPEPETEAKKALKEKALKIISDNQESISSMPGFSSIANIEELKNRSLERLLLFMGLITTLAVYNQLTMNTPEVSDTDQVVTTTKNIPDPDADIYS